MPMLADINDVAKQLREMNKSYYNEEQIREMFIDTAIAEQRAVSSLNYDYSQAVNDAYVASLQNRNVIYDTPLGQGYKQQLVQQNQADLQSAFEQYRNNYMTNLSNIEKNTSSINYDITNLYKNQIEMSEQQAGLINDYFTAHFDYLQTLGKDETGRFDNLFNTQAFNDYFVTTDESGRRIKTTDELMTASVDKEGSDGGFYYTDEQGNQYITDYGLKMLSLIESTGTFKEAYGYSFGSYLEGANEKLWKWANELSGEYGMTGSEIFRKLSGVTDYTVGDTVDYRIADVSKQWENDYVTLNASNLVNDDYMDENAVKYLESYQWKIDMSTPYTAGQFRDNVENITSGQVGFADAKRGSIVRDFADAVEQGNVKNGTIVDVDYGGGEKLYIYWNGNIHPLINTNKSSKDNETNAFSSTVSQAYEIGNKPSPWTM